MAITAPSRGLKHEGSLTRLGYREHEAAKKRHRALKKAVRHYGYKRTIEKLTDLQVLNKNRNSEFSQTVRSDANFLRRQYRGTSNLRH